MASSCSKEPLLPTADTAPAPAAQAQSRFTCLTLGIVLSLVFCEVSKQLSNYSIQYLNAGRYPVPQTVLVVTIEAIKLAVTVGRLKGKWERSSHQLWRGKQAERL